MRKPYHTKKVRLTGAIVRLLSYKLRGAVVTECEVVSGNPKKADLLKLLCAKTG